MFSICSGMLDVTKQKDMSGFYRYLYRSTAGNEITPSGDGEKTEIKEEWVFFYAKTSSLIKW